MNSSLRGISARAAYAVSRKVSALSIAWGCQSDGWNLSRISVGNFTVKIMVNPPKIMDP